MTFRSPSYNRGLSLIELLVSLAIGLIVIGVGASSYIDVVSNTRSANVLGQMTEDANIALGIMRAQVVLAGYSRPTGVQTVPITVNETTTNETVMVRAFKGGRTAAGDANNFIYGCDGGFTSAKTHELDISQLTCASNATLPDAIAVVYEADTENTYPTAASLPTDCTGAAIPAQKAADIIGLRLASNKFYLNNNTLFCQGNGRADTAVSATSDAINVDAQAIVENIYDLQILYGVAPAQTPGTVRTGNQAAVAYLTAAQLNSLTGTERWSRVVSARICVEVRSATTVSGNEQTPYVDCQGAVQNTTDGRIARTFTTTVVLHNRI